MKISIVGGGGRVGLPLAISLAQAGHKIIVIDLDVEKVGKINKREMPFNEKDANNALKALNEDQLFATSDNEAIIGSDVCVLIIGTPVNIDGSPGANSLTGIVTGLIKYLNQTKLLMLRSTVYPGITEEISQLLTQHNLKTLVSFCPERIAEGIALEEIRNLPQLVGVSNDEAYSLSAEVFRNVSPRCIRTTYKEAEISKLFANSYRYFKFAIANEFFKLCVDSGINWENVWYSLKEDYPRAKDLPFPGFAAGPCLVKDTMQLEYFSKNDFIIGKSAIKVNEEMPDYVVGLLQKSYNLSAMTVGILGMTFKGDVDDFRSSLSFRLKNILEKNARTVLCSDEILQKNYFVSAEELIDKSDLVIIATPHRRYATIDIDKPVVDIWRINKSESII